MAATEAMEKELVYVRVDPENEGQIADASLCEREGFGTGEDPQEEPEILRFIAQKGYVWLQYDEGKPKGVIEFITLRNAMRMPSHYYDDFPKSPFVVMMREQDRVFKATRNMVSRYKNGKNYDDGKILYAHGIAVVEQGKGYGSLLQEYAEKHLPKDKFIVAFIDAAKLDDDDKLQLIPNEKSLRVATNWGFILIDIVDPPVYDEKITFYNFLKFPEFVFACRGIQTVNLLMGNAREVFEKIQGLNKGGYYGRHYNKNHEMEFLRFGFGFLPN